MMKFKEDNKVKAIDLNHKQLINISIAIFFILLLFTTAMIIFSVIIRGVERYDTFINKYILSEQMNGIKNAKDDIESDIYKKLKIITGNIETDILKLDNLDVIEKELSENKLPKELEEIFRKNIEKVYLTNIKNDDNDIFICNRDRILIDYSISRATEEDIDRTWTYEVNRQYNSNLARTTVQKLIDQKTDEMLVFERTGSKDTNHITYSDFDDNILNDIVRREGLEGLKHYTFLLPIYITETGDIFGNKDIYSTHIQKTNKFIVVQEYNLYQFIKDNNYIDNKFIEGIQSEYDYMIIHLKIFGISIIISVICSFIFIICLCNKHYLRCSEMNKK